MSKIDGIQNCDYPIGKHGQSKFWFFSRGRDYAPSQRNI